MKRFTAVLFTAILLAGCGGGGGGGSGGSARPEPTTPPPLPSFAETVNQIVQQSDTMISSDLFGQFQGELYLAEASCGRISCTYNLGFGYTSEIDLRDLRDEGLDPELGYTRVGEQNGIPIGRGAGRSESFGVITDFEGYGGWLTHSVFDYEIATVVRGSIGDVNVRGMIFGAGYSIGNDTGSRPTGSAIWRGTMVGGTIVNGPPQFIRGDATVTYDVAGNDLDVEFTNTRIIGTNARFQDMRWSNLSVDSSGKFKQETPSRDIEGRFYGPSHSEVGGAFFHSSAQASGAFGAGKQ